MQATIQSWGNSLAMRIPKHIAQSMNLRSGKSVKYSYTNNQLIISGTESLDSLLEGLTQDQIHQETSFGPIQGKEIW